MAAEQSSNHSGEPQIGIRDLSRLRKFSYYSFLYNFGDNLVNVHWDEAYLTKLDISNLQTFLLGGCGTSETLNKFQEFVLKRLSDSGGPIKNFFKERECRFCPFRLFTEFYSTVLAGVASFGIEKNFIY